MIARMFVTLAPFVLATYMPFCTPRVQPVHPPDGVSMSTLWEEPDDLEARDVFHGPWGPERAPDPRATYTFLRPKLTGTNPGVVVADPEGREWHVKQPPTNERDPEGPVEVVMSRILSAVGYHQPPVYFLRSFTMTDAMGTRTTPGGRFRLDVAQLKDRGEWSWQQNPFVGTKPYQGLLVILVMLNASDLKNSNNTLYELEEPRNGVRKWYVVRDIGTALGTTGRLAPRRGHLESFERLPFIKGVTRGFVEFEYHGFHQELLKERITPAEVGWACQLLSRLSDEQWADAFRAGGYEAPVADRFIRRLQEKIAEGRRWAGGGAGQ